MSNSVEMAPLAHISETTENSNEDNNSNSVTRTRENLEGIDDGLVPRSNENPNPTDGGFEGRRSPHRPNHTPENREEYFPVPTDSNYPPIVATKPKRPLDVNLYATKKTVAQGMMDLALLTANANQLRYVLESGNSGGAYYYFSVSLISLSIILQLLIGVALIFLGRYNVGYEDQASKADRLNNFVVLGVFLITSVNVFVSAFGIGPVEKLDPALIVDATLNSMKEKSIGLLSN